MNPTMMSSLAVFLLALPGLALSPEKQVHLSDVGWSASSRDQFTQADDDDEQTLLQLNVLGGGSAFQNIVKEVQDILRAPKSERVVVESGPRLQHTAVALQKLATAVVHGTEKIDDTLRDLLEQIRKDINSTIINSTLVDHAEDQSRVVEARDAFDKCDNDSDEAKRLEGVIPTDETRHNECRKQQATLNGTKRATCDQYVDDVMKATPPNCMNNYNSLLSAENVADIHSCLRKIVAWSAPLNTSLAKAKSACEEATHNLTTKDVECNGLQTTFEGLFCKFRTERKVVCSAYDQCYNSSISGQQSVNSSVRIAEAGRKASFAAAYHILCYLEIFELPAVEQPQKLESCNTTVDTSRVGITYYPEGQKSECELPDSYPCLDTWSYNRYEKQSWYFDAPPTMCTPCVGV